MALVRTIKNFVKGLLSQKGDISSKRCIALSGMLTLMYIMIYSQHADKAIDHASFNTMACIVVGAAGITAYEKVKQGLKQSENEKDGTK